MGVCEGVPGSIMPDHMGRADYHGASVNQAARFMDAGEEGGLWGDCNGVSTSQAARVMDAGLGKGGFSSTIGLCKQLLPPSHLLS